MTALPTSAAVRELLDPYDALVDRDEGGVALTRVAAPLAAQPCSDPRLQGCADVLWRAARTAMGKRRPLGPSCARC